MFNTPLGINRVKDVVCVLLHSSSKDNNLIVFGHFSQKLLAVGSN